MLRPKTNSCKEFDNEKKLRQLENSPPPPHSFSNGPSPRANWPFTSKCFKTTNINHKGLQRTANEYVEESRIDKDVISKNEQWTY